MVNHKYADEAEIRDKIEILFSFRKLTSLLGISGLDADKAFTSGLHDLQYSIYLLDAYLESTWDIQPEPLTERWEQIYDAMARLGYGPKEARRMLKEIRQYERIELNCRKKRWPTREPFKKFYRIKSCDVRLIRQLIYLAAPILSADWKPEAWKYYDMITEVNDDIADVTEDLNTFNGNRFLIGVLRKGLPKTADRYANKLKQIQAGAKRYFVKHSEYGKHAQLKEWTSISYRETLTLITDLQQKKDHSIFTTSWMLQKME